MGMTVTSVFVCVQLLCLVCVAGVWICGADYCTEGVHFCQAKPSNSEKFCFKCEDFSQDCFTHAHKNNCTSWCKAKLEQDLRDTNCKAPTNNILNGRHNGSATSHHKGEALKFVCNRGYTLDGSETITCGGYGVWSSDVPHCKETICSLPQWPVGDWLSVIPPIVNVKDALHPGDIVRFSCSDAYRLDGPEIGKCTENGTLTGGTRICCKLESKDLKLLVGLSVGGLFVGAGILLLAGVLVYVIYRSRKRAKYQKVKKTMEENLPFNQRYVKRDANIKDSGLPTPISDGISLADDIDEETSALRPFAAEPFTSGNNPRQPEIQPPLSHRLSQGFPTEPGNGRGASGENQLETALVHENESGHQTSRKQPLPPRETGAQPAYDDRGELALHTPGCITPSQNLQQQEQRLGKAKCGVQNRVFDRQDLRSETVV